MRKTTRTIKNLVDEPEAKIQTPQLPPTPSPNIVTNVPQKSPITNLTRTEDAVLSDTLDRAIAKKT